VSGSTNCILNAFILLEGRFFAAASILDEVVNRGLLAASGNLLCSVVTL
jgi:hypothetical protein